MGSCNPKPEPLIPPKKDALQLCCKRLKYHLQIKQAKINQEIIQGESQLVRKINLNKGQRQKIDELLLAQRIVNGLKYTAIYTLLIEYAGSIGNFSNFICQNINDSVKLEPWKSKLYSMLFAAEKMPITTLQDYKKCMNYIHNQILMEQYTDPKFKTYLTLHPTPEQMNIYFIQMSQRNNLSLDKINQVGHSFSPDFKPSSFDKQFTNKSSQYRNSLPKQKIFGKNNKNNQIPSNRKSRQSVANPFDKNRIIEGKVPHPNNSEDNNLNPNQNIDKNDVSPNITDLMKKIGSSQNQPK